MTSQGNPFQRRRSRRRSGSRPSDQPGDRRSRHSNSAQPLGAVPASHRPPPVDPEPTRRPATFPARPDLRRRSEPGTPRFSANRPEARRSPRSASRPPSRLRTQPQIRLPWPLAYGLRLTVLGVGVAGIAGTILSVWNPALQLPETAAETADPSVQESVIPGLGAKSPSQIPVDPELKLGSELTALKTNLQGLADQVPGLTLSAFLYDLDTQAYFNLNGSTAVSAASMIKVPVLVAFLQAVDAGDVDLAEPLTMQPQQIAEGSGDFQVEPPGSVYTALETASWMIINSDNTATNMIIDRLGGAAVLNATFQDWGLTETVIRNPLPDLDGTNTTSPADLVQLMTLIDRGELLSLRSRDRLLAIMQRTYTDTLLPQGIDESDLISHKTGDIGSLVGDVGLVDLANGKRYAIAVMVARPHNDGRAQELIRRVSATVHDALAAPLEPTGTTQPASP